MALGFADLRNRAELLLSPRKPAQRAMNTSSGLNLGFGGNAAPGVLSSPDQIVGPVQTAIATPLQAQWTLQSLLDTVSSATDGFQAVAKSIVGSTYLPVPDTGGTLSANTFLSFSSLKPGQTIPKSFQSILTVRQLQLQNILGGFSSATSQSTVRAGVTVIDDFNPQPYPHADELDVPTTPPLARGGAAALADAILQDKTRFVVKGAPIGTGKPGFWSRLFSSLSVLAVPTLNPVVNQIFKDKTNGSSWSEPPTPYAAQHPFNKVQQSESGHVIEIDDTPSAERIHLFHRSGSFIEMHPDGTVVYKNMKDGYNLTMGDGYVYAGGNCHITVMSHATLYAKKGLDVQVDADLNMQVKGDYNVYASNINLRAKDKFKADGKTLDLRYLKLPGIPVATFGGLVPRLDLFAVEADFPGATSAALSSSASASNAMSYTVPMNQMMGTPAASGVSLVAPDVQLPPSNPLSNPGMYTVQSPEATVYRAHQFDAPQEVNNLENYTAHLGLMQSLNDFDSLDIKVLGGKTSTPPSTISAPATKRTITYLKFADYKGKFNYTADYQLANTSYRLSDVVDSVLHPTETGANVGAPIIVAQGGLLEDDIVYRLALLAVNVLQPIKDRYPNAVIISGFRRTNSGDSQHERGEAVDLQIRNQTPMLLYTVADWIQKNLQVDELVLNFTNVGDGEPWIHVSFTPQNLRNAVSTKDYSDVFHPGLVMVTPLSGEEKASALRDAQSLSSNVYAELQSMQIRQERLAPQTTIGDDDTSEDPFDEVAAAGSSIPGPVECRPASQFTGVSTADAIDLSQVTWTPRSQAAVTAGLVTWQKNDTMVFAEVNDSFCTTDHAKAGCYGGLYGVVEGSQWMFVQINGTWYGGVGNVLSPGQISRTFGTNSHLAGGNMTQPYSSPTDDSPLYTHTLTDGEQVGLMVTTPANDSAAIAGSSQQGRTNVILVTYHEGLSAGGGSVRSLEGDVKSARAKYPAVMTDAQTGSLLNDVAWQHKDEGWGLLSKPTGANVPQPLTGTLIAHDILFHRPSGHIFDVLSDQNVIWLDDGVVDTSRFVDPVNTNPSGGSDGGASGTGKSGSSGGGGKSGDFGIGQKA